MHNENAIRREKKGTKEIFHTVMTERFIKLTLNTKSQIQEARKHQA